MVKIQIQMHAANNQGIHILGTASIQCSRKFPSEHVPETHQLTYVTSDSDKISWLWSLQQTCNNFRNIPKHWQSSEYQ